MASAKVAAICDPRADVAEEVAKSFSARVFTDVEKMLAEGEIDVVDICTPTITHADYVKAAAAAGKHVSCEKPLARTVEQAEEAVKACEDAGVTLFIAHVLRWFPEYRKLRELVKSGAVGEAVEVRTSRGGPLSRGISDWYADLKQSGGAVLDVVIHDFDWLRTCFGDVKRVYARGLYESGIPRMDYALVTLRFESGVIAHVEATYARPSGFVTSVEIAGNEGLLNYRNMDSMPIVIECRAKEGMSSGVIVPESPTAYDPYYLELEHFITCLEEGRTPDVTPRDGVEAVRICEAALTSITTGEPVVLR